METSIEPHGALPKAAELKTGATTAGAELEGPAEISPGRSASTTETPRGPVKLVGGFGVLFFGGLACGITALHLRLYEAGQPFDTLTGLLYTLGLVSLSPVFFYSFSKPLRGPNLAFIFTFAGVVGLTAPVFYFPDYRFYGIGLGALCLLLAIFPTWYHYFKLQNAMQGIEDGDAADLLDMLKSEQSAMRSMAKLKILEQGVSMAGELISAYQGVGVLTPHFRKDLLETLLALSRPPEENDPELRAIQRLAEFWYSLLRTAKDYQILLYAGNGLKKMQDVGSAPLYLELLKREFKQGGMITQPREAFFDILFDGLSLSVQAGDTGAEGVAMTREIVNNMLDFFLIYPGLYRSEALMRMGGPLVAAVAARLSDATPRTRQELARLLGGVKAVAAMPMLIDLVKDDSPDMRFVAVEALLEYLPSTPGGEPSPGSGKPKLPDAMGRQITDALLRLARDPEERVRLKAMDGLSRVGDPQSVPVLLDYLGSPPSTADDASVRGQVAANLARTRDPHVLDPLLRLLDGHEPAAQAGAARGLGFMRDPRVIPKLKKLLDSADLDVAASAAIGLFHQKDESGRAILSRYVALSSATHRSEALDVLLKMTDESVYPALERGIGGPKPGWSLAERDMAIVKLIEAKTPKALEVLSRVWSKEDLDEDVVNVLRNRMKAAGLLKA